MISQARKIVNSGVLLGIVLTLAVTGASLLGLLDGLEHICYDERARYCQFFTPRPTDRLVHLDIDDAALEAIGGWPWHRSTLAEMVDEIHLAGPKAMAWDVIFPDPQPVRYEPRGDGKFDKIDDDGLFAASLRQLNCALLPLSLIPAPLKALTPSQRVLHDALTRNLELTESEASEVLRDHGLDARQIPEGLLNEFLPIRREVMFERLMGELQRQPRTRDQLRAMLLPHTDRDTPAARLLDEQLAHVRSQLALLHFVRPVPSGISPLLHSELTLTPVPVLSSAIRSTGFVDFIKERGVVRRVPLFMEHGGQIYPQIAVALAAMMLDTDINHMQFSDQEVTILPPHGPPVQLPVYSFYSNSLRTSVPMMFDVPWFGAPNDGWQTMYDKVGNPHLSFNVVWDVCLTRRRIRRNNAQADDALRFLYSLLAPEKFEPFQKHPLPLDDALSRLDLCRSALADYGAFIEDAEKTKLTEIKDPEQRATTERLAAQGPALRILIAENPKLQQQLVAQREGLRKRFAGRAILVGWASTAQTADQVATSIHASCPGAVIHGTIFNAIMTRHMWRRVTPWTNIAVILLLGGATTLLTSRLSPTPALVSTVLLVAMYVIINGALVFDWGNHILGMAGPIVAAALVWSGITVTRFIAEAVEHRRIRKRFQSYVDPSLVEYLYEHPGLEWMQGEVREMTVCFTDLIGFTTLTEKYRERAVPLLGRYTSRMVPIIRRHHGLLVCFMGDGLMFVYAGPRENPNHAADAVKTIMEMFPALEEFNKELAAEGYPPLGVRAGVSTGNVVVGDTGGADACDYTCLGDVTNFGARLESANKLLGTRNLISARTVELLGDGFFVRPIACLRVAGKKEGIKVYESLCAADAVTDELRQLAAMTQEMADHYLAAQFAQCLAAAGKLDDKFGPSKLTKLYRDSCSKHLESPPDDFAGHIILDQK